MRIKFDKYPKVFAGISEKNDGSMVWSNRLPVDGVILDNRERYFKKLKINPKRVISGGIAHGTNVVAVGKEEGGKYLLSTDALITNIPNLFLTVTIADCMPIFCYDAITESLGIIHAGWRGLVNGILENTIQKLNDSYNVNPENLQIIIGPHIKVCHYEVGQEVAVKFAEQNIEQRDSRLFANLAGEAKARFHKLGVKNIDVSLICNYEDEEHFCSARRDKNKPLKGMVAYIGLKL